MKELASPIEQKIQLACLLECTARKVGNVHPGASFEHISYADFVESAAVAAPILALAPAIGVGQAVLNTVRKTQTICKYNTNLGIALVLAPLAAVDERHAIEEGIDEVLFNLSNYDAVLVYDAIRTAAPRGLGTVDAQDVDEEPTQSLLEVMQLGAETDDIAWEYSNGFATTLEFGVPYLAECKDFESNWETHIINLQIELMARRPDTDIARKCGKEIAQASAQLAQVVVDAGGVTTDLGRAKAGELDEWLRARGSLRNPGTTADIVTGCLFAALRENLITPPSFESIQTHANQLLLEPVV